MPPLCSAGSHAEYRGRNPCLAEGSWTLRTQLSTSAPNLLLLFPECTSTGSDFPWKGKACFSELPHSGGCVRAHGAVFGGAEQPGQLKRGTAGAFGSAERCSMAHSLYIFPDWYHGQGLWALFSAFHLLYHWKQKEIQVPLILLYWANTDTG